MIVGLFSLGLFVNLCKTRVWWVNGGWRLSHQAAPWRGAKCSISAAKPLPHSPLSHSPHFHSLFTLDLSLSYPPFFSHPFSLSLLSFLSQVHPVTNSQPLSLLSFLSSLLPPSPSLLFHITPLSSSLSFLSFRFPFSIERDFQSERWSMNVSVSFTNALHSGSFKWGGNPFQNVRSMCWSI